MTHSSGTQGELSVHIEHQGSGYYYLLGTPDRKAAAAKALEIYRLVMRQGWETANEIFSRELTIALRWFDSPLAWTYTTIHTRRPIRCRIRKEPGLRSARRGVVVVESDPGIRHSIAGCLEQTDGFACEATFPTRDSALRNIPKLSARLALISSSLSDSAGVACARELKVAAPLVAGLLYSVYEDSEELFRSTPGGATNYLLQRTASTRFLDPIAMLPDRAGLSHEAMSRAAWDYFKKIFNVRPAGFARVASDLTPREDEVIAGLSKGFADKDIADRLRISVHTVREHVRNIFKKLSVHNRTEAVVKFLQK